MPKPTKPEKEIKGIADSLIPKTKEEWIDFLIQNTAYPCWSINREQNIFFQRMEKDEVTDRDLFKEIIKKGAIEKLGLKTEEDCKLLRNRITAKLHEKREYKPTIKNWPEDDRPREKLFKSGEHALSNTELIAILLRSGTHGQSAIDLSRKILSKFKTFRNMSHTDIRDWKKFKGLGQAKIAQIKAALEIGRRFREDEVSAGKQKISSAKDIVDILMPQMRDLKTEIFKIVYLDSNNRIIDILDAATGTVNQAMPIVREIIHSALQKFAVSIVCAHNHPSANITPSTQDKKFTKELSDAGKLMEIKVLDHIIIGDNEYYSFADEGVLVH